MDPIIPQTNPPKPETPDPTKDLPTLRTYATDMAEALKKTEGSVMKIAIAEANRREERGTMEVKEKKRGWLYVLLGLIFVALAGGVFYGINYFSHQGVSTVTDETAKQNSFIYADASATLNVDGFAKGTIMDALVEKLAEPFTGGTLENIYLEHGDLKRVLTKTEFMTLLGPSGSATLTRALGDGYMLGVYKSDSGNEPFIALEVSDFDIVFAEMLKWEPKMINDLSGPFSLTDIPTSITLSSTPFVDKVFNNQDTRIILDPATNNPLLFYAFLDTHTLLIARTPELMSELQKRIVTKHAEN